MIALNHPLRVASIALGVLLVSVMHAGAEDIAMRVDPSGDVGVGTETPAAPLHVKRDDGTAQVFIEEAINGLAPRILLEMTNDGEPQFRMTNRFAGATWFFTTSDVGDFKLSRAGTGAEEFGLDSNGNLKLRGNLIACATSLIGSDTCDPDDSTFPDFPDYVFEPGYQLRSLSELEAFIATEKHLPNVMSAADARAGGINMTKLQLQTLEKVEELALYTIAQEKKLAGQQEEMASKDAQIAEMEQRLARLESLLLTQGGRD